MPRGSRGPSAPRAVQWEGCEVGGAQAEAMTDTPDTAGQPLDLGTPAPLPLLLDCYFYSFLFIHLIT